jgi:hypothetical protein
MTSFPDIQQRTLTLVCPECGTCSMDVVLRCDGADRECLAVASCRHCRKKYDAELLPTHLGRYETARKMADGEPCPGCGGHPRSVRSRCDRLAGKCFLEIVCHACGDVRSTV